MAGVLDGVLLLLVGSLISQGDPCLEPYNCLCNNYIYLENSMIWSQLARPLVDTYSVWWKTSLKHYISKMVSTLCWAEAGSWLCHFSHPGHGLARSTNPKLLGCHRLVWAKYDQFIAFQSVLCRGSLLDCYNKYSDLLECESE
jgi:hypothetical protein